jgi:hypothetical protein
LEPARIYALLVVAGLVQRAVLVHQALVLVTLNVRIPCPALGTAADGTVIQRLAFCILATRIVGNDARVFAVVVNTSLILPTLMIVAALPNCQCVTIGVRISGESGQTSALRSVVFGRAYCVLAALVSGARVHTSLVATRTRRRTLGVVCAPNLDILRYELTLLVVAADRVSWLALTSHDPLGQRVLDCAR